MSATSDPHDREIVVDQMHVDLTDHRRAGQQRTRVEDVHPTPVVRRLHVRRWLAPNRFGEGLTTDDGSAAGGASGRHRAGQSRSVRRGSHRRSPSQVGPKPPGDRLAAWFLRVGLAFVFLYASVAMLFDPAEFTAYMPSFLPMSWVETVCLPCFSVYEVALAVCLLAGRRLFAVSLLSALTMGAIVVANPDSFDLLFRNVAIACAALSLAAQSRVTTAPLAVPAAPAA